MGRSWRPVGPRAGKARRPFAIWFPVPRRLCTRNAGSRAETSGLQQRYDGITAAVRIPCRRRGPSGAKAFPADREPPQDECFGGLQQTSFATSPQRKPALLVEFLVVLALRNAPIGPTCAA